VALPAFLLFAPVPLRVRRDGWTARRQRLFILRLACGDRPAEAARQVGCSRQAAYALRRRAGAESFAAAWEAAQDFADDARRAGRGVPPRHHDFETLFVPRFYRGKLVGYVQREDHQDELRRLSRLDRLSSAALRRQGFDFDRLVEEAVAAVEADKADGISV
jgi:hypothetical protein